MKNVILTAIVASGCILGSMPSVAASSSLNNLMQEKWYEYTYQSHGFKHFAGSVTVVQGRTGDDQLRKRDQENVKKFGNWIKTKLNPRNW